MLDFTLLEIISEYMYYDDATELFSSLGYANEQVTKYLDKRWISKSIYSIVKYGEDAISRSKYRFKVYYGFGIFYYRKHGRSNYWYSTGKIKQDASYIHDKLHGFYRQWYPNGQLKQDFGYYKGQRHGPAKEWYENGRLKMAGEYDHGQLHGLYREWNEDGNLWLKQNYDKNRHMILDYHD